MAIPMLSGISLALRRKRKCAALAANLRESSDDSKQKLHRALAFAEMRSRVVEFALGNLGKKTEWSEADLVNFFALFKLVFAVWITPAGDRIGERTMFKKIQGPEDVAFPVDMSAIPVADKEEARQWAMFLQEHAARGAPAKVERVRLATVNGFIV